MRSKAVCRARKYLIAIKRKEPKSSMLVRISSLVSTLLEPTEAVCLLVYSFIPTPF